MTVYAHKLLNRKYQLDGTPVNMIVKYEVRNVYGNERLYPANGVAQQFAQLTNTTTLSRSHLQMIRELGFTVQPITVR